MTIEEYKQLTANYPSDWMQDHKICWSAHNDDFTKLKDNDELEVGLMVIQDTKWDDDKGVVLLKYSKNKEYLEKLLNYYSGS